MQDKWSTLSTTTAVYTLISIICCTLVCLIAKYCINRRKAATAELASSLEAFAYEENNGTSKTNNSRADESAMVDPETSSRQAYHNLAGGRPTTPAVF